MKKIILFICTENSARSQMAEGFFNFYNKNPEYAAMSAGMKPAREIKPLAIQVMAEKGIDISKQKPKIFTSVMAEYAPRIFTMGCVGGCPLVSKEKTKDWKLEDPDNKPIEKFREIRNEIEERVKKLVLDL